MDASKKKIMLDIINNLNGEGFKKDYLSEYLEVNMSTINRWYNLNRFPRPSKFKLLADLLYEDVNDIEFYKNATISDKIMILRYFSGLSLEELSDSIIISRPILSNLEMGHSIPTDIQLERLAMFYDIDGEDFGLVGSTDSIGSKIRQERLALGLTQSYLAKLVRLSPATISSYERDLSTIPSKKLDLIANELELTVAYLVGSE